MRGISAEGESLYKIPTEMYFFLKTFKAASALLQTFKNQKCLFKEIN